MDIVANNAKLVTQYDGGATSAALNRKRGEGKGEGEGGWVAVDNSQSGSLSSTIGNSTRSQLTIGIPRGLRYPDLS